MEESWAGILVCLGFEFGYPEKAGAKVMLGYTQFLEVYLHHAEKVDAVTFSKTFFFRRKQNLWRTWNPSCFLVPSLPCSKKTWLENCCVVDSTWLIEQWKEINPLGLVRPRCLLKPGCDPWYHPHRMRISRLRIYNISLYKDHLCSTSRMSGGSDLKW